MFIVTYSAMPPRAKRRAAGVRWIDILAMILSIVLLLVTVVNSASAQQQDPKRVDAKPTGMSIEVNKGRLIRLNEAAVTVFIADPGIADIQVKSPTLVYIFGKKAGETTLIAVGEGERVLLNQNVTVNHNLSRLTRTLRALMPGNTIQVRSIDGAVVLSGTVETPQEAEQARLVAARFVEDDKQVINSIAVNGPNQVNLRVRMVEMSRQTLRDIGINWQAVIEKGALVAGLITSSGISAALPGFNLAAPTNLAPNFRGTPQFNVTALINLLETEGLVRVLAEPNLSAMSGKTASFLAGGEFPVPVPQNVGVTTIEFKKFGVGLNFTPTILSGSRINLKVAPEVSQLSSDGAITLGGVTVSALTTRRADTTVELASGQSFIIAGLLQRNVTDDLSKVPGIGSVPVLGKLFQSEKYQRNETELVIIVTPYIVRPMASNPGNFTTDAAPVPYADPQRIVLGKDVKKTAQQKAPTQMIGKIGFELE